MNCHDRLKLVVSHLVSGDIPAARDAYELARSVAETDSERSECHSVANQIQRDICAEYSTRGPQYADVVPLRTKGGSK